MKRRDCNLRGFLRSEARGRFGKAGTDAMVLTIMVLVTVASIEGMVLFNSSPVAQTVTRTVASALATETAYIGDPNSTVVSTEMVTQTVTATEFSTRSLTVVSTSLRTVTSTLLSTAGNPATSSTTTTTSSAGSTSRSTASSITTTSTSTTTGTQTTAGGCRSPCLVRILPQTGANASSAGYSPAYVVLVIGVNNTLVWGNYDSVTHTVVSQSTIEPFTSGDLLPNQAFTFTFTIPGTYNYFCIYHSWMHGTVVVKSR